MKRGCAIAGTALLALVFASFPLWAHHGGSEYDTKNPITLKGTVTEYYWANPHCQIYVDVKDDKGKTVNWAIETLAPAVLKRAGWNRDLLHPGDAVTITLVPSRNGTPVGMVRKLVLPNGQELGPGQIGEQPPQ
jgi:hypothetical protein